VLAQIGHHSAFQVILNFHPEEGRKEIHLIL
jgi:hypothetical protein